MIENKTKRGHINNYRKFSVTCIHLMCDKIQQRKKTEVTIKNKK